MCKIVDVLQKAKFLTNFVKSQPDKRVVAPFGPLSHRVYAPIKTWVSQLPNVVNKEKHDVGPRRFREWLESIFTKERTNPVFSERHKRHKLQSETNVTKRRAETAHDDEANRAWAGRATEGARPADSTAPMLSPKHLSHRNQKERE